jgi:membrane protease YdiL (CAAX protease family)
MPPLPPFLADRPLLLAAGVLLYGLVAAGAVLLGRRLLPPPRQRAVPWTAFEIVTAIFLVELFWMTVSLQFLLHSGLGEAWAGPEAVEALRSRSADPGAEVSQLRLFVRASLLAFPLRALTVPFLLARLSGTRPYQLGLTLHRWRQNLALGVLGCAVVAPPVHALHLGVQQLYKHLSPESVTDHAFTELGQQATPGDLAVIVLLAVVAAPVLEETVFRGMLQPWLARRPWGGHLAVGLAAAWAVVVAPGDWQALLHGPGPEALRVASPLLFVAALLPAYAWVCRRWRSEGSALFGTALLFAMTHSKVWPSPVPLFVLALALGWLARRTGSLVGPVVLHALFNAIASVQLIQMAPG